MPPDALHAHDELTHLRRQRDQLHLANNREVERRREAERQIAAVQAITQRAMEAAGIEILNDDPALRLAELFTVLIGQRDMAR